MTVPDLPPEHLATVRRFEAAGFRAWPAETVHYDGTWAIRLTRWHPARRLNSINPLDPADTDAIDRRIAAAAQRFEGVGRALTFRLSPLAGREIPAHLDRLGWSAYSESLVMSASLDELPLGEAIAQIQLKDLDRFMRAATRLDGADLSRRTGLADVIRAIGPETGLLVIEESGAAVATGICVRDGDLASFYEIITDRNQRGRGHGRRLMLSAMHWARARGARTAWLQVEGGNAAGRALYGSLGFSERYRYVYRSPPEG